MSEPTTYPVELTLEELSRISQLLCEAPSGWDMSLDAVYVKCATAMRKAQP